MLRSFENIMFLVTFIFLNMIINYIQNNIMHQHVLLSNIVMIFPKTFTHKLNPRFIVKYVMFILNDLLMTKFRKV